MRKLPAIIFLTLVIGAVITGACSYRHTERYIQQDVRRALAKAMADLPGDRVDADTIRRYRSNITIDEVRDTACISVRAVMRGSRQQTELVAESGCSALAVFMMSDQRASAAMLLAGALWMAGGIVCRRQRRAPAGTAPEGIEYGGLTYYAGEARFTVADGAAVKLTPMQQQLMEMFFTAEGHRLPKQEICARLWPKKPDANDTLYTLIRRLKAVTEANSRLTIVSDRGKAYCLEDTGDSCERS